MKRNQASGTEFMRNFLAFLLIGAFIGAMGVFTFFVIPTSNKDVITYMVGQLSGMASTILGFYFVSKVGQEKLEQQRTENTAKALDAIRVAQESSPTVTEEDPDALKSGDTVVVNKDEGEKG